MNFDWRAVVSTIAPIIGTAFGGPLGGMAARAVSTVLLGKEDASDAELAAAVQAMTPEQAVALKKAGLDFQEHMRALDIDLERIAAGDRDSARKMQSDTRDWTPRLLAVLLTLGFFSVLAYMLKFGIPKEGGGEALLVMLGALGSAFAAVCNFYYGSSAGSARKDEALAARAAGK